MGTLTMHDKAHSCSHWTIGLAMFAMFFGAGNITFPLALGQYAGSNNLYAICGLLITAVFVPFLGLVSMLAYNGNYRQYFDRIGKLPGIFVAMIIMALIGPFGALPRCIVLSHSTFGLYWPVSISKFSLVASLVIFGLSFKKSKVVDILGKFLTPALLVSLILIIVLGFINPPSAPITDHAPSAIFWHGLKEGYNTMDLFAALFFSIVIIPAFQAVLGDDLESQPKRVGTLAIKSSLVGMIVLGFIYASMSFIAAFYMNHLHNVPIDKQLGSVSNLILGQYAGLVANLAVSLACLTTAITLAVVFAEFVRTELLAQKVPYWLCLLVTLLISMFFCDFGFKGIMSMVGPILVALCPALITLAILNLAHRFYGITMVKLPVYLVFALTLVVTYVF